MINKDAYYFSHDCNARNDEKVLALRMKFGWEGYGIYWAIIEKLRESKRYELSMDFNIIAFDLRTDNQKIKSIVTGFGLFSIDEESSVFYSNSLKNRMLFKESKSKKASYAAKQRWKKEKDIKKKEVVDSIGVNAELMRTHSETYASKVKESKVKKSKVNNTDDELKDILIDIDILKSNYLKNERLVTAFIKKQKISKKEINQWLIKYNSELESRGAFLKTQEDYQMHFLSWFRIQKNISTFSKNNFSNKKQLTTVHSNR